MAPPCVCVIGWSGSGKTTLLTRLLPELRAQGLRVLALKHSGHAHPLHKPGSDTQRLAAAGASAVGLATPEGVGLVLPGAPEAVFPELLEALGPRFDLILVEGWKDAAYPKLEVWRAGLGPCLAAERAEVVAIVTDDPPPVARRHFRTDEVAALARFLARRGWEEQAGER